MNIGQSTNRFYGLYLALVHSTKIMMGLGSVIWSRTLVELCYVYSLAREELGQKNNELPVKYRIPKSR